MASENENDIGSSVIVASDLCAAYCLLKEHAESVRALLGAAFRRTHDWLPEGGGGAKLK